MIIISTFNIQNDIKNFSKSKTNTILNYLTKNKIDILGLQEVYSKLSDDLEDRLSSKYNMFGKYRYFIKFIFNRINEKTPIITNYNVISNRTYRLPILPSTLNRVITKIEVEIDEKIISIYNTHLDYMSNVTKKRQLKKILKLIIKDNNPIVLMGDFNLKNNNDDFKWFVNELAKININLVDVNTNTWKSSKYNRAIDHIFVSSSFKIKSKEVIKDIDISDHYPIMIKVELI